MKSRRATHRKKGGYSGQAYNNNFEAHKFNWQSNNAANYWRVNNPMKAAPAPSAAANKTRKSNLRTNAKKLPQFNATRRFKRNVGSRNLIK